ncbi:MAG: magnesium transporter CorA family protein [Acidimicrobiia bacterium]|nr:magnesium transporter CorA family protein [Acidimicrobiia bacterium]
MIELFHSTGTSRPVRVEPGVDLAEIRRRQGWVWVDVVAPDPREVSALATEFGLEALDVGDVLDATEYPNIEERAGYLFVIAHSPSVDRERLRTVEVDAFLGSDFLITVRQEQLPAFEAVAGSFEASAGTGPDDFLALLLDIFVHRIRLLIDNLDAEVDRLEAMAIIGDPNVVQQLQGLRRDVVRLRRVLIPQREVLRAMARSLRGFVVSDSARSTLDSSFDDCQRALEELDSARLLLASALDTYRATVAERMNEVMKVLTVFSAIVLPLGLLAGLYGMNFVNMPELSWKYGYFALLGVMGSVGLGLWIYFARRGFVGSPRVPRLDRAVGRGLASFVHLTLVPARTVWNAVSGPEDSDSGDHRDDETG